MPQTCTAPANLMSVSRTAFPVLMDEIGVAEAVAASAKTGSQLAVDIKAMDLEGLPGLPSDKVCKHGLLAAGCNEFV